VELWYCSWAFKRAIGDVDFSSCNSYQWRSSGKDRHIGFHGVDRSICDGFKWIGETRR
jgi:hypothetical protein